jgi:hypothetical protein
MYSNMNFLQEKFLSALKNFYIKDCKLVEYKVAERALTHNLAEHLQDEFPEYDVDCEYNKVGEGDPKRIGFLFFQMQRKGRNKCCGDCDRCRKNKCVIFPDIIVHKRGQVDNLIVVEAKTVWSSRSQKRDFEKLEGLVRSEEYGYALGIGVVFGDTFEKAQESIRIFSQDDGCMVK